MEDESPLLEESRPLLEDISPVLDDQENDLEATSSNSNRNPLENLDLDKLLEQRVGQFGRYQKTIYVLVCLPSMLTAMVTMASVFSTLQPRHRCMIPGCDSSDPQYNDGSKFQNFSIPVDSENEYDSCRMFQEINDNSSSCFASNFDDTIIIPCQQFVYDTGEMEKTVTMKYDLVCDKKGKVNLSQSIFFGGVLAGALVFGQLGDYIGRKSVFMIALIQTVSCSVVAVYVGDLVTYNVLQFLTAMGQVGLFQACFVLGVELVGPKYRVFCGVFIEFFFVCGELILAFLAWYFRDWKKMTLAYMIPSIVFVSYYFFVPKSVRWLLSQQRYEEAEAELQKVAKWNKKPTLTQHDFYKFSKEEVEVEVKESFIDLLKRPKLVVRLSIVFLCWIVVTLVYYGLSLAASNLAGDVFLNFTLLSLTEFPGYALSYLGMQYAGRKATMIASLLISGTACLISPFLPQSMSTLSTILFLTGKFGATSAFGTIYLYTSELFPTSVRNLCIGLSSMMGRFGAIAAPYIKNIGAGTSQDWIPLAIFGVSGIISGFAVFLLNETKGKPLPRTLDEAENLEHSDYQQIR